MGIGISIFKGKEGARSNIYHPQSLTPKGPCRSTTMPKNTVEKKINKHNYVKGNRVQKSE